jgi:hypothetical protein
MIYAAMSQLMLRRLARLAALAVARFGDTPG